MVPQRPHPLAWSIMVRPPEAILHPEARIGQGVILTTESNAGIYGE